MQTGQRSWISSKIFLLDVDQFNLQKNQVEIAAKSDTVAQKRYEVTKQRFLIGKIAVLDLNDADSEKTRTKERMFRLYRITGTISIHSATYTVRFYKQKTA